MDLKSLDTPGSLRTTGRTSRERGSRLCTISDLAREFGTTLRTLRFYEGKGLLTPHRVGTQRLYDDENRRRLSLILKGKALGFSLKEIQEMLRGEKGDLPTGLDLTLSQIDEQINHLERQRAIMLTALQELRAQRRMLVANR